MKTLKTPLDLSTYIGRVRWAANHHAKNMNPVWPVVFAHLVEEVDQTPDGGWDWRANTHKGKIVTQSWAKIDGRRYFLTARKINGVYTIQMLAENKNGAVVATFTESMSPEDVAKVFVALQQQHVAQVA